MIPSRNAPTKHLRSVNMSQIEARICMNVGPVGVRAVGTDSPAFELRWYDSYIGPTLFTDLRGIQIERSEGALSERWADYVFLVVQKKGSASCLEAGLEFHADPGDLVLVDPCLSSRIGSAGPCQFLSYTLPRSIVTSLQDRGLKPMHTVIGRAAGITQLLNGTLDAMLRPVAADKRATRAAYQVISDLLAAALTAQDEDSRNTDSALMDAMRDWATERAGLNRVGVLDLAREFGMSERGLYRLFARHDTTPDRWLWRCRIDAATRRMETQATGIKTIAMETGFKNVSHFSKLFREVHGVPPTAYRYRRDK